MLKGVTSLHAQRWGPETKPKLVHQAEGSGEGAKLSVSIVMASAAGGKREIRGWEGMSSVEDRKQRVLNS